MKESFNNDLSDIILKIGKACKKYRKLKKLTQVELAIDCDCETSTISRIERFAIENISIRTLIKISIVLEIELIDFF